MMRTPLISDNCSRCEGRSRCATSVKACSASKVRPAGATRTMSVPSNSPTDTCLSVSWRYSVVSSESGNISWNEKSGMESNSVASRDCFLKIQTVKVPAGVFCVKGDFEWSAGSRKGKRILKSGVYDQQGDARNQLGRLARCRLSPLKSKKGSDSCINGQTG